jgi:hypothetical protein
VIGKFADSLEDFDETLNFVEFINTVVVIQRVRHNLFKLSYGLSLLLKFRINDIFHTQRIVFLELDQKILVLGFNVQINPIKSVKKVLETLVEIVRVRPLAAKAMSLPLAIG